MRATVGKRAWLPKRTIVGLGNLKLRETRVTLPLTALRAFDLVARHGSFTRAAAELNVTRPAVSKQIRLLEASLGCQLVIRGRSNELLTETGRNLAAGLQQGFDLIGTSYQFAGEFGGDDKSLRILVDRDFASSWLAKRIGGFLIENPGATLEIIAERNGNLRLEENFSFRIFYGPEGSFASDQLDETALCDWIDLPLCTPDYAAANMVGGKLDHRVRFLIDRNYDPREDWFLHSGVTDPDQETQVSKFDDTSMCLSAALSGSGITIGDSFMALDAIRSGRLIAPFKIGLQSAERYAICRAMRQPPTRVEKEFRKWLLREIESYQLRVTEIMEEKSVTILPRLK
ncbi:HTH-type transcriptional activator AmpR [Antarctobacter heliothermus]|uniref:HTH-type transcriptional activator AmpR n=1 Tax=Antarctobacter heliothermus TaxID=74033 RepID=A0A222E792_9RHOB|nr:HTH-type transcriptional activator AmpR [Antarctobacter heliothermus]